MSQTQKSTANEKPTKPKGRPKKPMMAVGLPPRANFMPTRIVAEAMERRARRRMFALQVTVLSTCFAAFLGSTVVSFSGDLVLQDAQLRLSQIKAEKSKYNLTRDQENEVRQIEAARLVATASEIDTEEFLKKLTALLPNGASFDNLQILPIEMTVENQGLAGEAVVKVTMSITLRNYPSLQTFLDRLALVEAFADSKLDSVSSEDGQIAAGVTAYFNGELFFRRYGEPFELGAEVPEVEVTKLPTPSASSVPSESASMSPSPTPTASAVSPSPEPEPSISPTPTPTATEGVSDQ